MAATDTTPKAISQSILTHILSAIKSFIPTNVSELNNDKNYATADSVSTLLKNKQDTLTFDTEPILNSKNPVTSNGIKSALNKKADASSLKTVATTGSYNDLTNKPTIPTVPTKVSAFTNDAGYLTAHQDLSGYQTKLTFDTTPSANSTNPVTSSGIKAAIEAKTVDLSGYAQLASPALTGTPTAPTASAGTNTTQIATTAFVATAISNAITKIEDGDSKSY